MEFELDYLSGCVSHDRTNRHLNKDFHSTVHGTSNLGASTVDFISAGYIYDNDSVRRLMQAAANYMLVTLLHHALSADVVFS